MHCVARMEGDRETSKLRAIDSLTEEKSEARTFFSATQGIWFKT